jgi:hypothetical protein
MTGLSGSNEPIAVSVGARRAVADGGTPFGILSMTVGIGTLLMECVNVTAGLLGAAHMVVGVLLLAATVPAGLGMGLAMVSLIRRERDRSLGHYGLWLNGTIAVFATPVAIGWALAVR